MYSHPRLFFSFWHLESLLSFLGHLFCEFQVLSYKMELIVFLNISEVSKDSFQGGVARCPPVGGQHIEWKQRHSFHQQTYAVARITWKLTVIQAFMCIYFMCCRFSLQTSDVAIVGRLITSEWSCALILLHPCGVCSLGRFCVWSQSLSMFI